jgi:hypothetical protein
VITEDEADRLAAALLGDRRTKLGGLDIAHARRVAAGIGEKTSITISELLSTSGDRRVVELVDMLTKRAGESEHDYLSRCASHPTALAIKRVDLINKLESPDTAVAVARAERIRRTARQRLHLLEQLARAPAL